MGSNATIHPDDDLQESSGTYKGLTTLYAECTRVGGTRKPSAEVKLLSGERRTIRLSSLGLSQELGNRLYHVVGLDGEAEWDLLTNEMVSFYAERLTEFTDRNSDGTKRTVVQAFDELARASKGRWEKVDPEEYVTNLRRD